MVGEKDATHAWIMVNWSLIACFNQPGTRSNVPLIGWRLSWDNSVKMRIWNLIRIKLSHIVASFNTITVKGSTWNPPLDATVNASCKIRYACAIKVNLFDQFSQTISHIVPPDNYNWNIPVPISVYNLTLKVSDMRIIPEIEGQGEQHPPPLTHTHTHT